jgi:DnaB-like helicase N terminal domain/AAA domain
MFTPSVKQSPRCESILPVLLCAYSLQSRVSAGFSISNVSSDLNTERPLPHSLEAERAIIGAILLGSKNAEDAMDSLQESDFFLPLHQVIFRHMKLLREGGKPAGDIVLLYESIQEAKELEEAGGIAYLSQIADGRPQVCNIVYYAGIVKQKAELRKRLYIVQEIREKLLNANGNSESVLREVATLSAPLKEEVGQKRNLRFRSGAEIALTTDELIEWIVPGFVAKGAITELGAKVKAGKTTLISKLVRAVADGLDFLGKPTLKTPTVYLTEQPVVSFRQAMERADLLGRDDFHVLLHSDTQGMPWPEIAGHAVRECKRVGAKLLVVDTLPQFAGLKGDSENNSGDALAAMEPLLRAAAEGIGIILVRHERKSGGDVGDSGRGSSAFAGAVDIVVSLRRPEGNAKKTLRVLQALSRFSETPAELLIELTDGAYISLGDPHDAAVKAAKDSILTIAPTSEPEAADLKQLMESADVPRATAQRALKELVEEGELTKLGEGKRGKPFKYWQPEKRFCPTFNVGGHKEDIQAPNAEVSS